MGVLSLVNALLLKCTLSMWLEKLLHHYFTYSKESGSNPHSFTPLGDLSTLSHQRSAVPMTIQLSILQNIVCSCHLISWLFQNILLSSFYHVKVLYFLFNLLYA